MTNPELQSAIDRALSHVMSLPTGEDRGKAQFYLDALRKEQLERARNGENNE